MLFWSSGPVCKDVTSKSLEVKFTLPCGAKESVPVSFIQKAMAPPRPRTHWCPVILATSSNIGGVATSSVVTCYGGDLVAKVCRTYWVSPAGRCRGMSPVSYGLAQGLQRTTVTRGLAAGPDMFEGRSRYNNLSPRGRLSGWLCAGEGPTAIILKGPVQLRESFSLRLLLSAPLRSPCRVVAVVL